MSHTDLEDRIDSLESLRGEGTELVTVTVPAGKSIAAVRQRIADEHAGAENVRSDQTRERVRRALDRVHRVLREYEETPANGLAVVAGVVDGDLVSATFDELPDPITESTYRCDDRFRLDPVRDAVGPSDAFGLLVVERDGAAVGRLVGDRVVPIRTLDSRVMGSSRAGGQSAKRFERERARQEHEFFERVAAVANGAFVGDGGGGSAFDERNDGNGEEPAVTGLAVGGTLTTAETFVGGDYLDYRLTDRLVGTYTVEYATERGLRELADAAAAELLDADQRAARERLDEFFRRLRDGDRVAYGDDVDRAIEFGAVETALISAAVPGDRGDEIETAVSDHGGETVVVPGETERGGRFAEAFRVGALLRFPVN